MPTALGEFRWMAGKHGGCVDKQQGPDREHRPGSSVLDAAAPVISMILVIYANARRSVQKQSLKPSCCFTMVVAQHSAESLAPFDWDAKLAPDARLNQQLVAHPLMITFAMERTTSIPARLIIPRDASEYFVSRSKSR
jgi:hypothetical protein